ncbi:MULTISPECIES: hypothetical protein [Spirulina sp. CCY15215]|uniref:hypothetical protein n=1 Tax=Spirulina sp. CCY15215 TaxID=2767591 RepID=UPI001951F29A|nr:hypothetical protein [Spirulina major]
MAIAQLSRKTSPSQIEWDACQYISQDDFQVLEGGDWVSLFDLPSQYAHYEALLLCKVESDRWITWIPDHGEIELCLRQFCPLF